MSNEDKAKAEWEKEFGSMDDPQVSQAIEAVADGLRDLREEADADQSRIDVFGKQFATTREDQRKIVDAVGFGDVPYLQSLSIHLTAGSEMVRVDCSVLLPPEVTEELANTLASIEKTFVKKPEGMFDAVWLRDQDTETIAAVLSRYSAAETRKFLDDLTRDNLEFAAGVVRKMEELAAT